MLTAQHLGQPPEAPAVVGALLQEALVSLGRRDSLAAERLIRRAWTMVNPREGSSRDGGLAPWQVLRVRTLAATHFAERLPVNTAAIAVGRSVSYF